MYEKMLKPAFIFDGRKMLNVEQLQLNGYELPTIGETYPLSLFNFIFDGRKMLNVEQLQLIGYELPTIGETYPLSLFNFLLFIQIFMYLNKYLKILNLLSIEVF